MRAWHGCLRGPAPGFATCSWTTKVYWSTRNTPPSVCPRGFTRSSDNENTSREGIATFWIRRKLKALTGKQLALLAVVGGGWVRGGPAPRPGRQGGRRPPPAPHPG